MHRCRHRPGEDRTTPPEPSASPRAARGPNLTGRGCCSGGSRLHHQLGNEPDGPAGVTQDAEADVAEAEGTPGAEDVAVGAGLHAAHRALNTAHSAGLGTTSRPPAPPRCRNANVTSGC